MSRVLFCGDLHLDHKNVHKFRPEFKTAEDHDEHVLHQLGKHVNKRDVVYFCGDIAFSEAALLKLKKFPFRKILVKGNHDKFSLAAAAEVFEQIHGITVYKNAWVSHAPIHPNELYRRFNIHGHVHRNTIDNPRYINVSLENIGYAPITFDAINYFMAEREKGVDIALEDHVQYGLSRALKNLHSNSN